MTVTPDNSNEKFILTVENPAGNKVRVRISKSATQLYTNLTEEPYYMKIFNMQQAEDGIYTITISDGKKRITKKLSLTSAIQMERKMRVIQ